jgi:hypothetical protein
VKRRRTRSPRPRHPNHRSTAQGRAAADRHLRIDDGQYRPACSFYFSFGLIVVTAGIAAPLTIVAAIAAIALLANTLAQFSWAQPSTGASSPSWVPEVPALRIIIVSFIYALIPTRHHPALGERVGSIMADE